MNYNRKNDYLTIIILFLIFNIIERQLFIVTFVEWIECKKLLQNEKEVDVKYY